MELKQWQLVAIVIGTFAVVVAIDVLLQYQGNETFRASFPKLPTAGFANFRKGEMVEQEMRPPSIPTFNDPQPSED